MSEFVTGLAVVVGPVSVVGIVAIVFGHRFRGRGGSDGVEVETKSGEKH